MQNVNSYSSHHSLCLYMDNAENDPLCCRCFKIMLDQTTVVCRILIELMRIQLTTLHCDVMMSLKKLAFSSSLSHILCVKNIVIVFFYSACNFSDEITKSPCQKVIHNSYIQSIKQLFCFTWRFFFISHYNTALNVIILYPVNETQYVCLKNYILIHCFFITVNAVLPYIFLFFHITFYFLSVIVV